MKNYVTHSQSMLACLSPSVKNAISLAKAKYNLDKYYTVVGLTEDLPSFFKVLEKLLPRFFTGGLKIYSGNSKFKIIH